MIGGKQMDTSLSELFTEVADAIRNKKGTTDKIVATDFPKEINDLSLITGEALTITPSTEDKTYTPAEGKNAFTEVTALGVTSEIDANIKPENIKKDVTILGVTGDVESGLNVEGSSVVKCFATDSMGSGVLCSLTTPPDQSYKGVLVKGCPITAKDRKLFRVFKPVLLSACSQC